MFMRIKLYNIPNEKRQFVHKCRVCHGLGVNREQVCAADPVAARLLCWRENPFVLEYSYHS